MKKISFLILTVFAAQLLSASYAMDKKNDSHETTENVGNKTTNISGNKVDVNTAAAHKTSGSIAVDAHGKVTK